jgi:hypothetical protein
MDPYLAKLTYPTYCQSKLGLYPWAVKKMIERSDIYLAFGKALVSEFGVVKIQASHFYKRIENIKCLR